MRIFSILARHFSLIILIPFAILAACTTTQSSLSDKENYTKNDDQYRNRYKVTYDANEKPIRYWYSYIVSEIPEGFKVRVFHPEKKTLIEEKEYSTSALTLLHGDYKSWWDDGSIRAQGIYQYGRKHSVWLESEPGHGKSISGEYLNDRKEGQWTQLDTNGVIESVYTYKDGLRHGKYYLYDSTGQKTNEGLYSADTLISELFKRPVIALPHLKSCEPVLAGNANKCSMDGIAQYVYTNLEYPAHAKKMYITGFAVAQWDVYPDGSVKNLRVPQALSDEIEAEIRKVLKKMPDWEPATKDGKPIKWTVSLPIEFNL